MPGLLYKLKRWLTLTDAAAHLSIAFGENVTEADVLRLGLDRHLTLSVDFVNGGHGRLGKVIPRAQATFRTIEIKPRGKPPKEGGTSYKVIKGLSISKDEVLEFDHRETRIASIGDIWDVGYLLHSGNPNLLRSGLAADTRGHRRAVVFGDQATALHPKTA